MDSKTKTIAGIALVIAVLSSVFIATPTLAATNSVENGDQVRDQERLRTRDMSCDGKRLQTQERERLRIQNCSCGGEPLGTQNQACDGECSRYCQGGQYSANAERSNSGNLERKRSQHRR